MKRTLLLLLRDAMCGVVPSAETRAAVNACADPEGLLRLAEQHNILSLVGNLFLQAKPEYSGREKLRQYIRVHVGRQIMASQALKRLVQALEEQSIPYFVVKGAALRALYPEPDCRPSTDEDVFVAPAERENATRVLLSLGYTENTALSDEAVRHFLGPQLHVELHLCTKSELPAADARFRLDGLPVHTLGAQEHLLFLAEHFYAHFVHGGVGIRQVADMVLLAQQPEICWEGLWDALEERRLAVLVCGLMQIGVKYLGLPEQQVQIPDALLRRCPGGEILLEDILDSGVFGSSTMERRHSSTLTAEGTQSGFFRAVFPGRKRLSAVYPYLNERPWLLPLAWSSRLVGYLREDRTPGKRAAESMRLAKQRRALMKQYDLID